jgi:diguanylate cyclase (GGDEF)-like protein/PAS domain S-box-containing protein
MMVATRRLERRLTYLLAALAVLTVLTLVTSQAWSDRSQRLLQLERDSRNLTASIAVLVGDRLKRVDGDLVQLRTRLAQSAGPNRPLDLPNHLQWIGADGKLHGSSGALQPGSSDVNTLLAFHRGATGDLLWIGEQQLDASSGQAALSVSRAVRSADGAFAGVVVGALPLDEIEHLSSEVQLGTQGAMGLSDSDGRVLARWPALQATTGRYGVRWESRVASLDAASGPATKSGKVITFAARSPADGVDRFYAQAAVGDRLVITVGTSIDEYLAPWWRQSGLAAAFVILACALAAGLWWRLRSVMQRESVLRRDLTGAFGEMEHLRHAIDMHAMVSITDEAGNFTHANARFCAVMHLPAEALLGRHQRIFHSGVHPRGFFDEIDHKLRTQGVFHGTICERDRLGHIHWFDITTVSVRAQSSGHTRLISLRTDVTSSRKAVDQLRRDLDIKQATNDVLHQDAHTDALTGLPNRRAFDTAAAALLVRARDEDRPAALLLMDVDWFKVYNDKQGHAAGDEALRRVAAALRGALRRAADQVYRYGGEEFAVLLQPNAEEDVWALAQTLRVAVSNMGLAHPGHPENKVTISLGYRTIKGGQSPANVEQWIESADEALYRAKAAGRNCCVQATGPRPGEKS